MPATWDVAVIGAGLSGLVAARRLRTAGFNVAILEARSAIGGRVEMARVGGFEVGKGGTWASRDQLAILRLAETLGIAAYPSALAPDGRAVVEWNSLATEQTQTIIDSLSVDLAAMIATVPVDRPWDGPYAHEWDAITIADWFRARTDDPGALDYFDAHCTLSNAWDWADTSFLFQLATWKGAGGVGHIDHVMDLRFSRPPGAMAEMIAAELSKCIRLNWPVTRIDASGECAVVQGTQGHLRARRVIVAMSPSDAGNIAFEPELPAARQDIQRLYHPGCIVKTNFVYQRPFWLDQGFSGNVRSDAGCPVDIADDSPQDRSSGRLVAFSYPFADRSRFALPADCREDGARRKQEILARLIAWFGPQAATPVAIVDTDWTREQYVAGVLGSAPVGLLSRSGAALRQPVGLIHWAGSESAVRWAGYVCGAVEAGERAAAEVQRLLTQ